MSAWRLGMLIPQRARFVGRVAPLCWRVHAAPEADHRCPRRVRRTPSVWHRHSLRNREPPPKGSDTMTDTPAPEDREPTPATDESLTEANPTAAEGNGDPSPAPSTDDT